MLSLWFLPPSSLLRSGDRVAFSCWWTCWTTEWRTCTAAPAEPWGTWCTAKLTTTTRSPSRTAEAYRHWSDCSARPQMWRSESCSQVRNKQNIKSNCKYSDGNKCAAGWIWETVLFRNDFPFLTNLRGTSGNQEMLLCVHLLKSFRCRSFFQLFLVLNLAAFFIRRVSEAACKTCKHNLTYKLFLCLLETWEFKRVLQSTVQMFSSIFSPSTFQFVFF